MITSAAARTVDIAWWVTATAASIEAATVAARSLTPVAVVLGPLLLLLLCCARHGVVASQPQRPAFSC
jgi:phage terminase large subunit-like protein